MKIHVWKFVLKTLASLEDSCSRSCQVLPSLEDSCSRSCQVLPSLEDPIAVPDRSSPTLKTS
jgi:hypothetical protein